MKQHTTLIGAVLLAFTTSCFAVTTVSVNNFNFPAVTANGLTIVDNAGNPLSGVAFAVGTLSAVPTTPGEVLANFGSLGTGTTGGAHFTSSAGTVTSPQDDSSIFVVFGNGASIAASTDFIVIEGNSQFSAEDPVFGLSRSVNIQNAGSTVVYGQSLTSNNTGVNAPFTAFTNGVTFGNIPEPSTSMLFGAAGLALLIRRKR